MHESHTVVLVCASADDRPESVDPLLREVAGLTAGAAVVVAPSSLAAAAARTGMLHVDLDGPASAVEAVVSQAGLLVLSDTSAWEELTYRLPLAAVAVPALLLGEGPPGPFTGHVRRSGQPLEAAAAAAERAFGDLTDADRVVVLAALLSRLTDVVTAQRASLVELSDLIRRESAMRQEELAYRDLRISALERRNVRAARRLDRIAGRLDRVRERHARRIRRLERDVASMHRLRRWLARALTRVRARFSA